MALTDQQIKWIAPLAKANGVELAVLIATVEVESGGKVFDDVNGEKLPLIRWEGHYFYKLLKGAKRDRAVKEGLASPKAGSIKNPSSQASRYAILKKAVRIDAEAAYSSISIGVGQVMGAHAERLGYASAKAMFDRAAQGLSAQVEIMIAFIKDAELLDELQRRDWSAFARGYNGPAYAAQKYDTKLASAYKKALKRLGVEAATVSANATGMLRLGSKGAAVREVQTLLARAGLYSGKIDSDFGPATKKAVQAFQRKREIEVDGVVGPTTMRLLQEHRASPSEALDATPITQMPEVVLGAGGGVGGGLSVAKIADQVNSVADKIQGGGEVFNAISNGLYVLSGALVLGGLLWAGYAYLKSRRTYEGTVR